MQQAVVADARQSQSPPVVAWREVLLLALASPVVAELISGSTSPAAFLIPWVFALFVLFYGCGVVLIRECSIRWHAGWWGALLLGAAFACLQEGLATRGFFDPAWRSLGPLAQHGRWAGVNWIWMADAILYHAAYSVGIPILLVYVLRPASQADCWLNLRVLALVAALFAFSAAIFLRAASLYRAPGGYLAACAAAIVLLCIAAKTWRPRWRGAAARRKPAWAFATLGMAATAGLIAQIYVVPQFGGTALTVVLLLAGVAISSALLVRWTAAGTGWDRRQQFGLVVGALICFACLDFFQEFNAGRSENMRGASLVGAGTLFGLLAAGRRLRSIQRQ